MQSPWSFVCVLSLEPLLLPPSPNSLVFLDVLDTSSLVSESFSRVVFAESLDERIRSLGYISRELHGVDTLQDTVISLHRVGAREGGRAWVREGEVGSSQTAIKI